MLRRSRPTRANRPRPSFQPVYRRSPRPPPCRQVRRQFQTLRPRLRVRRPDFRPLQRLPFSPHRPQVLRFRQQQNGQRPVPQFPRRILIRPPCRRRARLKLQLHRRCRKCHHFRQLIRQRQVPRRWFRHGHRRRTQLQAHQQHQRPHRSHRLRRPQHRRHLPMHRQGFLPPLSHPSRLPRLIQRRPPFKRQRSHRRPSSRQERQPVYRPRGHPPTRQRRSSRRPSRQEHRPHCCPRGRPRKRRRSRRLRSSQQQLQPVCRRRTPHRERQLGCPRRRPLV
mmetsp:Transcript_64246/g.178435  ORF Transcript_64246/g.178435 Transcript_64246/m.178435 type:complete len:279 (-) Transcript_64246:2495-3331(-)